MGDHVALDLAPQRAGGDGQGHVDDDVAAVDADGPDHAEVDDGVAELGVDHRPQAVPDLLLAGSPAAPPEAAAKRRRCHEGNCTCVAGIPALVRQGCWAARGAGNMDPFVGAPCASGCRSPGVGRNEEDPVTTMSTSVNIGKKPAPVTLSDGAVAKVAELLAQEEGEELALRVAVKPGGCSGLQLRNVLRHRGHDRRRRARVRLRPGRRGLGHRPSS